MRRALLTPVDAFTPIGDAPLPFRPFLESESDLYEYTRDLEDALRRMHDELDHAGRLQRELFAVPLPDLRGLSLHVLFEPAGQLSGDLYHVERLDETHIGIAIADATGHGPSAAILSTYVRQVICGGNTRDATARLEPAEVLRRLNGVILRAQLTECQSVASLYAVIDETTGAVRLARAGASLPILVRRGERALALASRGPLAGAVRGADFETVELRLEPGDRLYLHTDGVDALLLDPLLAVLDLDLTATAWFRSLAHTPPADTLRALRARLASARTSQLPLDDVTVVAVEWRMAQHGP